MAKETPSLPEPVTSWTYPPEMPGARVETYRKIDDVELKAYLFEPNGHTSKDHRPAVVFFFGGGWKAGTPGQFLPHCQHLAERGMVAIAVDYRVKSRHDVIPQDCVRDAKSAIRWVRTNAKRLGIDPDRIAAGGGSAGGHLAAAVAMVPGFDSTNESGEPTDDQESVSSLPNALILFNPAVVLSAVDGHPDLMPAEMLAGISERADGRPEEISPYHFIKSGLPPTIIFHGTDDTAVPFASIELFTQSMVDAGNRCELKAYPNQPHGFFNAGRGSGAGRASANQYYHATLQEMDTFLESIGYLSKRP